MKIILLCILLVLLNACTYGRSSADTPAVITMYNKQEIVKCGGERRVVLIGGCFDLLHYGHLEYLRASKQCHTSVILGQLSVNNISYTVPPHRQLKSHICN